jgi:hypothetical protein
MLDVFRKLVTAAFFRGRFGLRHGGLRKLDARKGHDRGSGGAGGGCAEEESPA